MSEERIKTENEPTPDQEPLAAEELDLIAGGTAEAEKKTTFNEEQKVK